jgi:hypothetical protein
MAKTFDLTLEMPQPTIKVERLKNPLLLDGVPLLKGNGQPFDFSPIGGMLRGHAFFFATKSKITDGPAGGVIVPLPRGDLFFLGIREKLLEQAAHQELRKIEDFRSERGPMRKTVECVLTDSVFRHYRLLPEVTERSRRYGNYHAFELAGQLHYTETGILFGVLPTREQI